MESAERITTSNPSSVTSSSPSTSSVASVVTKGGLTTGVTPLSSSITACGHLFRASGDQPFNLSSAFPMISHPLFGLHAASSGHSEFGGLGTLGAPTALAAHPQLAHFPGAEWWRATDPHTRAAFFPPLLGIPPIFSPPSQNHDSSFHLRSAGKNNRGGTEKGINGSINGGSPTLVTSNCTSMLSTTTTNSPGQVKTASSGAGNRASSQKQSKSDSSNEKNKDKQKQRKKTVESSSSSDSGSSSDTSSDGASSSDSDDLEEEDQSIEESDDDDSESESEAQTKKKSKVLIHNIPDLKTDGNQVEKLPEKRVHQQLPLVPDSQNRSPFQSQQKHPQVLSQHLPFIFQSSQAKEEAVNKHTSVIQCTGLVSTTKPLSLLNQSNKNASLKLGATSSDGLKPGNKNTSEEPMPQPSDLRIKRDHHKQTFPAQLKKLQDGSKHQKKTIASPPVPSPISNCHQHQSLENNHSNPFLTNALLGNHQPNGVIPCVMQDAPLALTTKSKRENKISENISISTSAQFSTPINLSSCLKKNSSSKSVLGPSGSPLLHNLCKAKTLDNNSSAIKTSDHLNAAKSLLDKFRGTDSDIPSSKDSDDSNEEDDDEDDDEDDEEEDEDDEDDDSDSQSESDSNSESDSEGSEDDDKDESDSDTEGEKLKFNKTTSSANSTAKSITAHSTPLNLQVIKSPSSAPAALCPDTQSSDFHSSSATLSPNTPCGSAKRRRVTDEHELRVPLEYGWQRETRLKNVSGRLQGEVTYFAPCGKKFRQYPEVMKYLSRNGIMDITRDNFSFSAKIRVGDFYEARDGPQGLQWCLLNEEEIVPRIRAMEGRRGRPPNPERQLAREETRMRRRKGRPPNVGNPDFAVNDDAKLLRKLQAQEIARQAAQIKLLRKLQRQEQVRAAKEAKKQQAIMAAEEKRKQKEQIKMMKQQEKIKRIEQIRMEKELRAQQILEEKEMRRQQAVLLKHQELERHRLDMVWERERRRQHIMLLKAVEARKKAEERERLKQEKQDEKRLNKERKLEQRRIELELAKELKKPTEDMCLADQKPLPVLPRIPGLVLSGSTFSNCLMVVQFLRNFGKVLNFDIHNDIPSLSVFQEGLLNMGDSLGEIQDLLVRLLSAAVCDPGVPPGYKAKTSLGEHLMNIGINRDNVSEILQIYMEAHCGQTEFTESLKTVSFQAHTPAEKASVFAFLVNELACSKIVVSEIDKSLDHMSNLRRDKWMVEGKLRKLRIIHAKKTGKRDSIAGPEGGEEHPSLGTPTPGRKRRRKGADSDFDDDDEDDTDDPVEEDDDEDEDKKGKKSPSCDDEDDGDLTATVEELEKQIEKLLKQQNQYRKKLFESSHSLRSMMFGQDRYRRRYWILPQCGGIFVEGMESGEGPEEMAKEKEKKRQIENIQIKEETIESFDEKPNCVNAGIGEQKCLKDKDSTNLFLQKPGSFSKLSKLLEVAKMPSEMDIVTPKPSVSPNGCSVSFQNNARSTPINLQASTSQCNPEKTDLNPFSPVVSGSGKFYNSHIIPNEQLLKTLTDKSRQWFSLLPRTPCDDTSITHVEYSTSLASTSQSQQRSQSPSPMPSPVVNSSSIQNSLGLSPYTLSPLQMKHGLPLMGLQFCGWPSPVVPGNLPFSSTMASLGLGMSEGNGHTFITPNAQTSKSESPVPQNDKSVCTPSPAVESPKQVDFPSPRPIPQEMQFGWWRIRDPEDLKSLLKVLNLRGIREKSLQKQIQKHLDYIIQACLKNKDSVIDTKGLEHGEVTRDVVENWCMEDQEMEVDIAILQQVEDLERRVASASLQVKGWMCPELDSEREDLVYHQHKPDAKWHKEHDGDHTGDEECNSYAIERKSDNPLDIAVTRLTDLERNIERRYLKSPLSTTIQIKLDNVGTVTVPAPAPSISGDGDGTEDDIAPGLKIWRTALCEARSAAQLSLCIQQLQKSIAWEKSIMKVYCQICRKGDNEELLLLCDGCDKGCHTYCHRPKITAIPEGDWFCPACIAKASGHTLKMKKANLKVKKASELKKGKKASGDAEDEDTTGGSSKKGSKDSKKRKADEMNVSPAKQEGSPPSKKSKTSAKDESKDLTICSVILSEMESHEDAWPFLLPVNLKLVPGYKKVIKKPMDFATIREKLSNGQYPNFESFALDIRLVFNNCETYNEDDSEIGRAGHKMRIHFEKRWTEIFNMS
ncbi:bromodomain adjacent to zinc finger domain protein 2B isoform X6 [Rhinoderma darwinii]|uniref:bromodomain adjacent to zinc finger domain protein 2B isoform X6 n=1 Tax=Rhinoderma darwinii TaxID=43563 RepID=UPI003F67FDE2